MDNLLDCEMDNLLDFQSYILLETGYPFAFYDSEKIQKKSGNFNLNFSIDKASENQKFLAANAVEYKLTDSNIVVQVNDLPISIAGIIENKEYVFSSFNFYEKLW